MRVKIVSCCSQGVWYDDKVGFEYDVKEATDLSYVTASVVDKKGNLCPTATNQLKFSTKGAGKFRVVCNGDATSLEQFHLPTMKTFSGKLVVTLQSSNNAGNIELSVSGKGLKSGKIVIESTR